ncbi:MAG: YdeI/OmpD-associated family protein [Acidobacteriota bacterium]|nr:YdeI/OmpD-associated family protein [Acidobacteriota bacterium]
MEKVSAMTREDWRSWLNKNHRNKKEIWLVYYKKATGKPSITYQESVEEAICFGWIDGIKKKIDEETYMHRFTPRKKNSKWSPLNIKYAKKMIEDGRMTDIGLAVFNRREAYSEEFIRKKAVLEIDLPKEIEEVLRENQMAWANFENLAPGYRKQYVGWLVSAKKKETRERRIKEALSLLEENKKLGMK